MSEIINPTQKWKLLARHRNVNGAEIREYIDMNSDGWVRRYTATIRGYQNWFIAAGALRRGDYTFQQVIDRVRDIRDKIDAGDKDVFHKNLYNPVLVNKPTITKADVESFEHGIKAGYADGLKMGL